MLTEPEMPEIEPVSKSTSVNWQDYRKNQMLSMQNDMYDDGHVKHFEGGVRTSLPKPSKLGKLGRHMELQSLSFNRTS